MFFIQSTGRYSEETSAETHNELGNIVTKLLANQANDAIMVSVGKTSGAVMPYVWIRRNDEDKWEGELGDCIKLGIDEGLLIETDPIQMLTLNQAIACGVAEVCDEETISFTGRIPTPSKKHKLSNEEKIVEAKRMVKDLFVNLEEDEGFGTDEI